MSVGVDSGLPTERAMRHGPTLPFPFRGRSTCGSTLSLNGRLYTRHGAVRSCVADSKLPPCRLRGVEAMSLYQLHRAVYDWVRAGEVGGGQEADRSGGRATFDVSRYELTEVERKALDSRDVAALYQLGLHAVLINRFARAAGFARDEYRQLLQPFATEKGKKGRWQK
jgi:hypothetical protein